MPGFIAAFSSAEHAASFMVSRGETKWENWLVADLRLLGMQGLCLDPTKDGAGTQIAFDDLQRSNLAEHCFTPQDEAMFSSPHGNRVTRPG